MRPIEPCTFTTADLEQMPDDGMRYELIDGVLLVTPTSSRIHQRALMQLSSHLVEVCPEHLEVMPGRSSSVPTAGWLCCPTCWCFLAMPSVRNGLRSG